MAGRLTTHVLDTATGRPAAGMALSLSRHDGGQIERLGRFVTDADGRVAAPLLEGEALRAGQYELSFEVAAWRGTANGFYDVIPIRFVVTEPDRAHHVPLVLSPFGYATYRGS